MSALTKKQKEKIKNIGFKIKFDNTEKGKKDSLEYYSGQTLMALERNGKNYFVDVEGDIKWVNPETGEVFTNTPRAEGYKIKDITEWINNNWFELFQSEGSMEGLVFHDLSQLPNMLSEYVR